MSGPTVLGIDFGGTKIALATATAGGRLLHRRTLETRAGDGARAAIERTLTAARRLIEETGEHPVAVGVSTFGVVQGARVVLAPNVPGWEEQPLPHLLEEGLEMPALLDNDVNAAAAAEVRWGRLAGVGVGLYVNVGTGLGAGIVVDGRVLRGANGAAGEIGYSLSSPAQPGHAAGRAPLEEYASGSGLAQRGTQLLGRNVTAAELFALRDDPRVAGLLDEALDKLGMAVANLAIALDADRVVLGGGMAAEPSLAARLGASLTAAVPFPPEVELARFTGDASLMGALALALDAKPP
ncbi:ROK family protein [Actinomadura rudentiformis]|uniref:ROK family protein n=1 Tax=Actinomadura rudentiformis TaxID=359158 RepID=A0A6H9YM58_9ACTN|nr:ROK family protein [Actinomadura rudentiformis]KAB2342420.1 ROK family protein [Actinomadura rudentiformis]